MSSLYAYLHIILLIFNNMIKNTGPDGDRTYFSATLVKGATMVQLVHGTSYNQEKLFQ